MRIAVYSHYFAPEVGAPSARIYDMARNWVDAGDEVEVATCYPNHPAGRLHDGYQFGRYMAEVLDGIRVHRNWTYITPNQGFFKKTLGHMSFVPSAMLNSSRRLQSPEVIIGTSPTLFAAQAGALAARQHQVPFVMEVRDLWPAIFVELGVLRDRRLIWLLERWELAMYRAAARVITVTDSFRDNLISRNIPANKVVTITNGADTDFWSTESTSGNLREELGLTDKLVVLYIGAHGMSHGLDAILKAAERVQTDPRLMFLFVGDGAKKAELVATAKRLGLGNVRFFDPVDKAMVRQYYAMSDICLVPLRDIPAFAGFIPSKMFEIMSMERPIIGCVRGEPAAILERSGAARVVPPEDARAIADAVIELANDDARRTSMGKAGRIFVEMNYSRHALAHRYREVLADVIEERSR